MTDWTHSSCKVPMVDRKGKKHVLPQNGWQQNSSSWRNLQCGPRVYKLVCGAIWESHVYTIYIYLYTYMYNYVSWCIIICNVYACSHIKSQSQHVTIGSPHFLPRAPERRAVRSSAGHRQPRSSPGDERFFCNGTFMENSLGSDRFMVFKPLTMSMDWLKGHF